MYFTSQLHLMLEVGTPVAPSVKSLAKQTKNERFRNVLNELTGAMESGKQLSEAMQAHPRVFNSVYVSMVRAGETGGFLTQTLERMSLMMERRRAMYTQLRAALTYPTILCTLAIGVIIFVLVGVLPKFMVFFQGKEHILPWTTRTLMALSLSIQAYWWAYLAVLGAIVGGISGFRASRVGRRFFHRLGVTMPFISILVSKLNTCSMLRTLGLLLESHVPLLDALVVTRTTLANEYYLQFVDKIANYVREGGKLARGFYEAPFITDSVKQMVATAEDSGQVDKVMVRLAEFYDKEIEQDLKRLGSLIEPLALLLIGGVIGMMVASIILPMFKLAHALR